MEEGGGERLRALLREADGLVGKLKFDERAGEHASDGRQRGGRPAGLGTDGRGRPAGMAAPYQQVDHVWPQRVPGSSPGPWHGPHPLCGIAVAAAVLVDKLCKQSQMTTG